MNFGDAPIQNDAVKALLTKAGMHPCRLRLARFVTECTLMKAMLDNAFKAAMTNYPVLIRGESGTGKELIAKAMLYDRPEDQFFPVNCAGLPDTLFESILFGYRKGAFTGATADKDGILTRAGTGVVFFDEVGELTLTQQAKLLRALQERRILPVGALEELPIACRFVFATNRDLEQMIENYIKSLPGLAFREDLFYRISAITLATTPLRQRPTDINPILKQLCEQQARKNPEQADLFDWAEVAADIPKIPADLIQSRGNVRALENWLITTRIFS